MRTIGCFEPLASRLSSLVALTLAALTLAAERWVKKTSAVVLKALDLV